MPEDNVIKFPDINRRFDVSNIEIEPESVAKKIEEMKLMYFSNVAEAISEDVMRSISILNLDETKFETFDVEPEDMIMLKETIMSIMCRIVGIGHPIQEIAHDELTIMNLELDGYEDLEISSYKFKDRRSL